MIGWLGRLVPEGVKKPLRNWVRTISAPSSRSILSSLHQPLAGGEPYYFCDPAELQQPRSANGLPCPPADMRMKYAMESEEAFLESGRCSADSLRAIMRDHGIELGPVDAAMEWGCATGRALRWFAPEAATMEFWGVDQHALSIAWAKENLAPPFRFLTSSSYPHLPFEDQKFSFIYALSVFTHVEHLMDTWLMEMRRILRDGGHAIFTICDEHTAQFFLGKDRPRWMPPQLDFREVLRHEVTMISGGNWTAAYTFFRTDWIRREWGRYFDILEIRPHAEGYQSAVVLRK